MALLEIDYNMEKLQNARLIIASLVELGFYLITTQNYVKKYLLSPFSLYLMIFTLLLIDLNWE